MTDSGDPYHVQRLAEQREHRRRWDAAAKRLGLDPNDEANWEQIRVAY